MKEYKAWEKRLLIIFSLLCLPLVFASNSNGSTSSFTQKSCFHDHYSALLQLKHSFRFSRESHTNLSSWDQSNTDCCTWEGITCDATTGSVIGLDLSSRTIFGSISFDSIFRLTSLKKLSLANNAFDLSPFPSGLDQLTSLTHLNLSHLKFNGQVPLDISHLTSLVSLDLSYIGYNAFSLRLKNPGIGALIQNLSSLRELHLDWVNIWSRGSEWGLAISSSLPCLHKLSLSACGLSGSLPSSLGNLSKLQHLDLSSNTFIGPIPHSYISKLLNLEKLILSHNQLTGFILPSLFSHPSLLVLDVSANQLGGRLEEFENASASPLRKICLGENRIQGSIPSSIFGLESLETLQLPLNNFSGVVELRFFQNLENLTHLDLSDNSLSIDFWSGNLTSFSFPQMQILQLRSCNISKVPSFLKNQERLRFIDLSKNSMTGEIPGWMWEVGNGTLNYLNLSFNALQGMELSFSHLFRSERVVLDLSSNWLKGQLPIPPSSSIYFSLSNNAFHGEIPVDYCSMRSLQFLDLSRNKLSGQIPQCLGEFSDALLVLNLGGNNLSGPLIRTFREGCNLRTLDLSENLFEGQVPSTLSNCRALDILNLGDNHITDVFPSWIESLSQLRGLILRNNKFYGPIANVQADQSFPRLLMIDISGNHFTGALPPNLFRYLEASEQEEVLELLGVHLQLVGADLRPVGAYHKQVFTMTYKGFLFEFRFIFAAIDVSNNCFEGNIPYTLGTPKLLLLLNMSHNSFSGQIPISLGGLTDLESLDLSENNISGEIPMQLTQLSFLAALNLSQNRLVGRIPAGRQFVTFSNDSFLGNLGLCGPPLTRVCPATLPSKALTSASSSVLRLDWDVLVVGFGVGYSAGLGVLFWVLAMWSEGRKKYSDCIDRMLLCFLPPKLFVAPKPRRPRLSARSTQQHIRNIGGRAQAHRGRTGRK
ncbi:hypothetical protein ACLOJK_041707 [Asimina triloba]